jgi:hypothetical protein
LVANALDEEEAMDQMDQKDINIPERAAFYMKNRFH